MKHKSILIGGMVGGSIGVIIALLIIQLSHAPYNFNIFIYMTLLILSYTSIGLIFSFIKRKFKLKWFIVGGIIGWVWGLLSFFVGIWTLEEQALKSFFYLPFYIAYEIVGRRAFFISPIIGTLIGLFIAFLIEKIKRKCKHRKEK